MAPYGIRIVGDPVLRQPAAPVTEIDGRLARLAEDMIVTMHEAPGVGLAAPQVGVQKRLFVYDLQDGDGAHVVVNPVITETRGEWVYEEGCLSVPGLAWEIVRPKEVHLTGRDLDGVLLLERLDDDQRRQAKRALRDQVLATEGTGERRRLRLPGRS